MVAGSTPECGDIVIRPEQREGTRIYVLHTAPGADQYQLRSREEAVSQAVAFAKHQHVRAWLTDDDRNFTLLEDSRVTAVGPGQQGHRWPQPLAGWSPRAVLRSRYAGYGGHLAG